MTSTDAVQSEIKRFLKSADPEVLCIVGEWGVGKTYNWQTSIDRLRREGSIGLSRYSYVSLFGINSLEGLKNSIFENMEFLVPEGASSMARLVNSANKVFSNAKQYADVVSAAPLIGNAVSKLQPHLFSTIRGQIICIDDLERRSKGLDVKDVFGLISFLREQRNCKLVLLLNEGELDKEVGAKEFADYFEKVIDTKVIFAPTAEEAVGIAITEGDATSKHLVDFCIKLGISNIRVIKKIERLVRIVVPLVTEFDPIITRQVTHSIAIFGWCKFDTGARPPPLDYLTVNSLSRYFERKHEKKEVTKDEVRWDEIISRYEFNNLDDFDHSLLEFVKLGVLDIEQVVRCAREQNERYAQQLRVGSFENAWSFFRDSFDANEDEVCTNLTSGITANFDVISLVDFDGVLTVLKGLDRKELVDELIDFAKKNGSKSFWSPDAFNRAPSDQALNSIAAERREAAKPQFDFETDLVTVTETLNSDKISQLAQVPIEQYRDLFASRKGDQLRRLILAALDHRKYSNASDDQREVVRRAEAALKEIASTSRLNAMRVARYGVN